MPANLIATGWALTELGEIRRRRGDQSGARDAFDVPRSWVDCPNRDWRCCCWTKASLMPL